MSVCIYYFKFSLSIFPLILQISCKGTKKIDVVQEKSHKIIHFVAKISFFFTF